MLHVENLKGATGEIALHVGDNEAFGVINVGDDAKLLKQCEERGLHSGEREFSGSLFQEINQPHSTVNILIGSKKFTEGWNSWRVSTMGLMNVGQTEGSQIIQLFGRGVRLKGFDMSLKRSSKTQLPDEVPRPKHIGVLETLSIFGIRANYMAQFRDFLEEEGLPVNDDRLEFLLPIIKNLGTQKLKIIRLKKSINGVSTEFGDAFRKLGPIPTMAKPDSSHDKSTVYLQKNQVVVNWYPKIQAMKSSGAQGGEAEAAPNQTHLTAKHVAFLDMGRLYFDLERFKAERGWYNLNITGEGMIPLLADQSWYQLLIPAEELDFDSFEKVQMWQQIALALLKKYTEHYYTFRKREWELPHLEYQDLSEDDPNFLGSKDESGSGYYRFLIERSQEPAQPKPQCDNPVRILTVGGPGLRFFLDLSSLSRISISRHVKRPSQIEKDSSGVHLWVLLWKASKAVEAHARRSVNGTELGLSDFGVLEALLHKGPVPISALGKRVLLSSGSMTAAVDRLERSGYAERAATSTDRRSRIVHLTEEGSKLIRRVFAEHERDMERVFSLLDKPERKALANLLRKLGHEAESIAPEEKKPVEKK